MFTPNSATFLCKFCNFITSNKKDYSRHNLTRKHFVNAGLSIMDKKKTLNHKCECGNSYSYHSGLIKHKQKCILLKKEPIINNNSQITPELIIELIHQNKELQQTLIDQNKTIMELAQKAGNNNNSNNNNKTFNLQVFLNETCKDAINLSDFVNQIQVSIGDLEETGKLGYAEGISKVFIKNLNDIDYSNRPIHCSDSKRETLYIKDDNQWTKDDEQKSNLTKAIKQVANKNIKKISDWQQLNPEYNNPDSKQNDKYMKIVLNSMSGSTKEEADKNYEKIAKNIAKEVIIEK